MADAKLDEEGHTIKAEEELNGDDNVVMIENRISTTAPAAEPAKGDAPAPKKSKGKSSDKDGELF
jgi:hypothetical protein